MWKSKWILAAAALLFVSYGAFRFFQPHSFYGEHHAGISWATTGDVEIAPRLGDRTFVANVLLDIFGPQAQPVVKKFVLDYPVLFGGSCDPYAQTDATTKSGVSFHCPSGEVSHTAPVLGPASPTRFSYMQQACTSLVRSDATLKHALEKMFTKTATREPSAETVPRAFRLFFPERDPSPAVVETLSRIQSKNPDIHARWRGVFYTLCRDPKWQII